MIREIDENSDGEIQFEEFVGVMSKKVNAAASSDEVKKAFRVFQENCPDNFVNVDSIKHVFSFAWIIWRSIFSSQYFDWKALITYGSEVVSPEKAQILVQRLQVKMEHLSFMTMHPMLNRKYWTPINRNLCFGKGECDQKGFFNYVNFVDMMIED